MDTDLAEATVADQMMVVTSGDLSVDVLADIFGFLGIQDIMNVRVCKKWKEAVKLTIPPAEFLVDSVEKYNAMNMMTRAMPNLQQITIGGLGDENKYVDGEDPDEARLLGLTAIQHTILES